MCIWALKLHFLGELWIIFLSCAKLPKSGSLIQSFDTMNQFRDLSREKKRKKKAANPRPNWSLVNAVGLSPVALIQHLTSVLSISPCQRPWIESLQLETLGNDWAKSSTHLQHSLISWERDGSAYVCVCESVRTLTHFITWQLIHYLKLFQHFLSFLILWWMSFGFAAAVQTTPENTFPIKTALPSERAALKTTLNFYFQQ